MIRNLLLSGAAAAMFGAPSAFAGCPDDWKEGLLMVVTGGIYCQFDEARDLYNDAKAKIAQIHDAGQVELDQMKLDYANQVQSLLQDSDKKRDDILRKIRDLAEGKRMDFHLAQAAAQLVQPAPQTSGKGRAITSYTGGAGGGRGKTTEPVTKTPVITEVPPCSSTALNAQASAAGAVQIGVNAKKALCDASARADATESTFQQIGATLDQELAAFKAELDKGYETSLFTPLGEILAGMPPPDPATLVIVWVATQGAILDAVNKKNDAIAALRAENETKLNAQKDLIAMQLAELQKMLAQAQAIDQKERAWENDQSDANAKAVLEAISQLAPKKSDPKAIAIAAYQVPVVVGRVAVNADQAKAILATANATMRTPMQPIPSAAQINLIKAQYPSSVTPAQGADLIALSEATFAANPAARQQVKVWVASHTH